MAGRGVFALFRFEPLLHEELSIAFLPHPAACEFKHECIGVGARKACDLVHCISGEGPTSPLVICFVNQLVIVKGHRVTLVAVLGVWVA